jgi:alpha-tubulin suppressor-like RCC1 family protein
MVWAPAEKLHALVIEDRIRLILEGAEMPQVGNQFGQFLHLLEIQGRSSKHVSCAHHSLVIAEGGVFCFGSSIGSVDVAQPKPGIIADTCRAQSVAAGGIFAYDTIEDGFEGFSLILTNGGKLLSFGSGEYGQLGHLRRSDEQIPKLVRALENVIIASVAAGGAHSLVLTATGALHMCICYNERLTDSFGDHS